ncbi:hypothetical protein [Bradyrhizobium diazoefficiens]|nr:hypothetical protein XF15B_24110 [Bradyrhizobium diazoefficiens]
MVHQHISKDPAEGFRCRPLPNGGYSWTLTSQLSELLAEAERRFGPRDMSWTPVGIEFCGDIPHLWYPGNRRHVSIILTDLARQDICRALFQLSHEVIHLLAPTGGVGAPVIEEGLATLFSNEISARHRLNVFYNVASYIEAADLTRKLLDAYPDGIRRMREKEITFKNFKPSLVSEMCPDFPADIAERLCQPFARGQ